MAGAIARARAVPGIRVTSAMVEPAPMDPLAEEVLAEGGLLSGAEPCVTLSEILRQEYDIVVVVCPQAAAQLPLLPGSP
jgi:arsenate reductase